MVDFMFGWQLFLKVLKRKMTPIEIVKSDEDGRELSPKSSAGFE